MYDTFGRKSSIGHARSICRSLAIALCRDSSFAQLLHGVIYDDEPVVYYAAVQRM